MPLIKTIQDFRLFAPANISFAITELAPLIEDVENEFIIPRIGQDLFDMLQAEVDASTISSGNVLLLKKIRNPLAKLSVMKWIPFGNLSITSGGFQVNLSDKTTVASQWRVDKLEESCRLEGWNLLEVMQQYLWSVASGTFTDYDASDERIEYRSKFFLTAKDFSKYYPIKNNYELFYNLFTAQSEVEEQYIKPTLGSDFYEQIKDQVLNDTLTADNTIILNLIKRSVAPLSIYEAIASMGVDLSYWGITTSEISDRETTKVIKPASDNRVGFAVRKAGTDGRKHLGALRAYLNNNASSIKYPLYYANTDLYKDPADKPDYSLGEDNINDADSSSFIMS